MAQDNLKLCPECGLDIPEHLRACVGCGLKREDLRRCAACEGYLGPNWLAFCGWCASPISTTHQTATDTPPDPPNNLSHTGHSYTQFNEVNSVASSMKALEGATDIGSNLIDNERTTETPDAAPDPEDMEITAARNRVTAIMADLLHRQNSKAREAWERAWSESDRPKKIDHYTEVIRLRPDYSDAFYNRGLVYKEIGEFLKAIDDFTEAIRLQPDYPDAFHWRGNSYGLLFENQKAIDDCTEAIRLQPNYPEAFYDRAIFYGRNGELIQSIDDFTEAIRLRPDYPDAFRNRGVSYQELGEFLHAIDDFTEAIRLRPDYPDAFHNRGFNYEELGEFLKAIDDLTEVIRLRPDGPDAFYDRGVNYEKLGEFLKAIDDFTEAIRLLPNHADAFRNRGICYREIGENRKAIDDFAEASRLRPPNLNNEDASEGLDALESLDLSARAFHALRREGLRKTQDLTQLTEIELLRIRNIDFSTVKEIKTALARQDKKLRDSYEVKEGIENTIGDVDILEPTDYLEIAEEVWSRPIERLGLSIRTLNCLKRSHRSGINRSPIRSFGDLVSLGYSGLMRVRNFGDKALIEVETLLAQYGLAIGGNYVSTLTSEPLNNENTIGDVDILEPTDSHHGVDSNGETLKIPLYDLIDIQEIGPRGALAIMGLSELTTVNIEELNIGYPSEALPLIPNALSSNKILTRLGRSKLILDHGNVEWEQKQLTGEQIVTIMEDISQDPAFTKELSDIDVTIRDAWLPHITENAEVQTKVKNGSSISHVGYDPDDAWEYLERGLRRRKQPNQANRLITILKARWQEGQTLEAIAMTNGLTKERVRQLEGIGINRLNELFSTVGTHGISNRLAWIESSTSDAVAHRGGYVAVHQVEEDLNWPEGILRFWFLFNSALGLLNQKQKNLRGTLSLGRVTLAHDSLSIGDNPQAKHDEGELSAIVQDIVGSSKVMRLRDVLAGLDHRFGQNEDVTSNPLARGTALEAQGAFVLLLRPEPSSQDHSWVAAGLGRAAREIARAILYGPIKESNLSINEPDGHLFNGVRTDLISEWLDLHSVHKSGTRAIESVCKRLPKVFAMTGATSFGLIGAGAQNFEYEPSAMADVINAVRNLLETESEVSKADVTKELSSRWSGGWINTTITLGLRKGYLTNHYSEFPKSAGREKYALGIGTDLPESEKWRRRKAKPQEHGQLIKLVITVLRDNPNGISEEHVLRRVRNTIPVASAESIYVYLNHALNDIIEVLPDRLYRLKEQSIRDLTEDLEDSLERFTQTSLRNLDSDEFSPFRSI